MLLTYPESALPPTGKDVKTVSRHCTEVKKSLAYICVYFVSNNMITITDYMTLSSHRSSLLETMHHATKGLSHAVDDRFIYDHRLAPW